MNCFVCDAGTLTRRLAEVEGLVKRKKYKVETLALVCDRCGHVAMEGEDTPEYLRKLADAYRKDHNLLTSIEIRTIRGHLSQQRFAHALGVGIASIKRWELGLVQDKGNDRLIRAFARHNRPTFVYEGASVTREAAANHLTEAAALWPYAHGPPVVAARLVPKSSHFLCQQFDR